MLSVIMSGLNVAQKDLQVTANNLANANTVGFKRSEASFVDLFSNDPSSNPRTQIGMGAATSDVSLNTSQGSTATTDRVTDLAITGRGYFTLIGSDKETGATSTVYSRAGSFSLDQSGYVVDSSGHRLQSFPVVDGVAQTGKLTDTIIPPERTPADVRVTLGAGASEGTLVTVALDGGAIATHQVTAAEAKAGSAVFPATGLTSDNASAVSASYPVTNLQVPLTGVSAVAGRSVTVANAAGALASKVLTQEDIVRGYAQIEAPAMASGDVASLTARYVDGTQETALTGAITGASGTHVADAAYQGVYLQTISINAKGLIEATYGDGSKRDIGAIALAIFRNDGGLRSIGNTDFVPTEQSGQAITTRAGSANAGEIMSGALEQANVDITTELMTMMKAQQVYNGNARMLQTAVEVTSRITDKI